MTEKIDTSMAERWLDPDTFVYKGKTYRVTGGYWTRGESVPLVVQEIKKGGRNYVPATFLLLHVL